jgi:glutamate dehydrogenase
LLFTFLFALVFSPSVVARIKKEALSEVDRQILEAFFNFNRNVLKTNFYSRNKSALSFRLNPSFLKDTDYPLAPFGLFFVNGSDFQGFHVRFKDIARGGIRLIRSADAQSYNLNLGLFFPFSLTALPISSTFSSLFSRSPNRNSLP